MTRTTLFSFLAVGLMVAACERHPASELAGEHEATAAAAEPASAPVAAAEATAGEKVTAPAATTAAAEPGKAPAYFPAAK